MVICKINNMKTTLKSLIITISIIMLIGACCNELFSDDKLTLERKAYNGTELRIDGYYYHISAIDGRIISIVFFYENGVLFYMNGDGNKIQDIDYWDSRAHSNEWIELMKKDKICWGIYLVDNQKIITQSWGGSTMGIHPVITSYGVIENDTTYTITKIIDSQTNDIWNRETTYHFRPFSPKPDSTNVFIK
ncbi:hypothetical protein MASR2M117_06860 [Paludibacter sp.]